MEGAGVLGNFWGGCDLQIEIGILISGFGSDTPCHAYGKGGGLNRSAHSAGPGFLCNGAKAFGAMVRGRDGAMER